MVHRLGETGHSFRSTRLGGKCQTDNDGDPIVLYDDAADRWLISQFAVSGDGHQCVAISTTGDPTGSYHRYDFLVSPGRVNDYSKIGKGPSPEGPFYASGW